MGRLSKLDAILSSIYTIKTTAIFRDFHTNYEKKCLNQVSQAAHSLVSHHYEVGGQVRVEHWLEVSKKVSNWSHIRPDYIDMKHEINVDLLTIVSRISLFNTLIYNYRNNFCSVLYGLAVHPASSNRAMGCYSYLVSSYCYTNLKPHRRSNLRKWWWKFLELHVFGFHWSKHAHRSLKQMWWKF